MKLQKIAAWFDLGMTTLLATVASTSGPQVDEPYDEPAEDHVSPAISTHAPNAGPVAEPPMRAVDGWILVSFLDGPPRRYYVGRDPGFIAGQLEAARDSGLPVFEYWDRPGYADAKKIPIACRLVTNVRPQYFAPDLDAIYADDPAVDYVLR